MKKAEIIVLYGGRSGEHEVSLRSAAAVYRNLDKSKYDITLVGISKKGLWYLQRADEADTGTESLRISETPSMLVSAVPGSGLFAGGEKLEADLVFPVLHGTFGEDGTVQGLLELCGLPYAGTGVMGSALGMDKEVIKKVWIAAGLDVVPFKPLNIEEFRGGAFDSEDFSAMIKTDFGYPVFVKPVRAGSSVGISKASGTEELMEAIETAFQFDNRIMIEPAVNAREIECSVTGYHSAKAYTPGEIAPTHEFYDYDAKYIDSDGAALIIPADIDSSAMRNVMETAARAYTEAGLDGMARVDFFLDRDSGRLLLNEVNTIPGFTSISMFSKMCEAAGLPYPMMLDHLIELGLQRHMERSALEFSIMTECEAE